MRKWSRLREMSDLGHAVEDEVLGVRVLPLLHTRDRNLTGDEAHGEHDNTHYHTLPHSGPTAAGYRLLKREVRVRVPASSTATHGPERLGYRLENAPTAPTCL